MIGKIDFFELLISLFHPFRRIKCLIKVDRKLYINPIILYCILPGYVLSGDGIPAQNGILQGMFGNPSVSAVVGIGAEHPSNVEANVKSPIFAQGPTHRTTVVALAQFLRRMHWQFVNVVLDRSVSNLGKTLVII